MKHTRTCPKCGSRQIVRIPDDARRYASGFVENWVETQEERGRIARTFG